MSVMSRGVRNALRNPLRSGIIVLMLAVSIGLVLCMLVARGSIEAKIADVKANTGNTITINPAGVQGFAGGGSPLTASDVSKIVTTAHITKTTQTLSDQLSSSDTSLTSSLDLGSFGGRFASGSGGGGFSGTQSGGSSDASMPVATMAARITVTGTTDPNSVSQTGGAITIDSGSAYTSTSDADVAMVGKDLANKNDLKVGSTFTAYGKTITVVAIYTTGSKFEDSGLIMPLATVQALTGETGDASKVVVTVDSSSNVATVVSSLTSSLGSAADITSELSEAKDSISSLQGIASLAFAGVIGAAVAGAVIILLTTIIIVRERRREIGVMKAIGGSNTKVVGQFIWESLTFTIIGLVIGLGLGVAVSGPMTTSLVSNASSSSSQAAPSGMMPGSTGSAPSGSGFASGASKAFQGGLHDLRNNFTNVTRVLTPQMFLIAIGITLLITVAGSVIPAWFIARIRPAEVLRTE